MKNSDLLFFFRSVLYHNIILCVWLQSRANEVRP